MIKSRFELAIAYTKVKENLAEARHRALTTGRLVTVGDIDEALEKVQEIVQYAERKIDC